MSDKLEKLQHDFRVYINHLYQSVRIMTKQRFTPENMADMQKQLQNIDDLTDTIYAQAERIERHKNPPTTKKEKLEDLDKEIKRLRINRTCIEKTMEIDARRHKAILKEELETIEKYNALSGNTNIRVIT